MEQQQIVDQLKMPGSAPAHDLTPFGLFMHADGVVKLVIILLLFASVWTWAVILQKSGRLTRLKSKAHRFEDRFWAGGSIDALYDKIDGKPSDPFTAVFCAAVKEWKNAAEKNLLAT